MQGQLWKLKWVTTALVLVSMSIAGGAPPPSGGCTEELLWFSACLPYVSSPPNNLTSLSTDCCNALRFQSYLCLCYLLRNPNFLGFPLNTTSLLSLSPLCNSLSTPQPQHPPLPSLNLLCSASPSLPPLNSPTAPAAAGGHRGGSSGMGAGIASRFPILNGGPVAAPSSLVSQILTILLLLLTVTLFNTAL